MRQILAIADSALFNPKTGKPYRFTRERIEGAGQHALVIMRAEPTDTVVTECVADFYPSARSTFFGIEDSLSPQDKFASLRSQLRRMGVDAHYDNDSGIAIGSTFADIELLDAVGWPCAFNPTIELMAHAIKQGWPVVIEEDESIIRLDGAALRNSTRFDLAPLAAR